MMRLDREVGLKATVVETVRSLAYPLVQQNDILVIKPTNNRYAVSSDIATIARHRGIDLVVNLRLEMLPTTHVVYKIPTPC
jgi:uncharacterized phosphosugar-binding protein